MEHRLKAKELREKRAPLAKQIRDLADRINQAGQQREFTSEEQAAWDKANAEYNELTRQIEVHERAAQIEADQERRREDERLPGRDDSAGERDQAAANDRRRCLALQGWANSHRAALSDEQREACEAIGINPHSRDLTLTLPSHESTRALQSRFRNTPASRVDMDLIHSRALGGALGSTGGYTVPEGFANRLEINMLAHGPMLQVAEIMRTETGEDYPWPTADDTGNEGEFLGENRQVGDEDPEFGSVVWKAYWLSSKMVRVPISLLQDSAFDLAARLGEMLGERIGRRANRACTTGSGANSPRGALTAASLGVTAASQTVITPDEMMELVHSVDPSYRPGARFMFSDNVLLHLRKKKDGTGNYIWQSSTREGEPDRMYGYPVSVNQHMPTAIATGAKTALFGQFSKYKVRQVRQIVLRRLVERYADYNQEAFLAFLRLDGNLLDAGTAPLKYLAQA